MVLNPEESAALRIKEATAATKVISTKDNTNLNVNNLKIDFHDQAQTVDIVEVIRMAKLDMILTYSIDEHQYYNSVP